MKVRQYLVPVALSLGLLTVACGPGVDGDAVPEPDTTASVTTVVLTTTSTVTTTVAERFPVTVESDDGPVTIEAAPSRIVSLSPTATEMLFAIGAGDQVVAVDDYSYYPPEAPVTSLSGFAPNVEAILGYEPDLLVISGGSDLRASVEVAGVPVLIVGAAATLNDVYDQIERLGTATGHVAEAALVVGDMRTRVDTVVASVAGSERALTYYHELDPTYYSVTSATFIGQVYALLGLENIADAADDGGGYPQLSEEYIIDANPDFIFLADSQCCGQSPDTVASRPGWDLLAAVEDSRVFEVDADIASRWGPRIVDFLEAVAAIVLVEASA